MDTCSLGVRSLCMISSGDVVHDVHDVHRGSARGRHDVHDVHHGDDALHRDSHHVLQSHLVGFLPIVLHQIQVALHQIQGLLQGNHNHHMLQDSHSLHIPPYIQEDIRTHNSQDIQRLLVTQPHNQIVSLNPFLLISYVNLVYVQS